MNKKTISIEAFFVMVLFMIFAISIVMMIVSGKNSYEKILNEKEAVENMRIAGSYFRMKIKQSNQAGEINVMHHEELGTDLLELGQQPQEGSFKIVVYYHDGKIWETYYTQEDGFDASLSEPVIDLQAKAVKFIPEKNGIAIVYSFDDHEIRQFVSLKTEDAL